MSEGDTDGTDGGDEQDEKTEGVEADADENVDAEAQPNILVRVLQTITPAFIRRSFVIKFGLVLLVMALSIGLIGLGATQVLTDQTEENVETQFQSDAAQQADIIEQWAGQAELRTTLLSSQDRFARPNPTRGELLGEDAPESIAEIHVFDDDPQAGPTVNASTSLESGTQLRDTDRDWVNSIIDTQLAELTVDEVYISDTYVYQTEDGQQYAAGFISPVDGVENRYLFVELDLNNLQQSLRGASENDIGFTQMVSTGGYFGDSQQTNTVVLDARGSENGKLLDTYATSDATLEPLRRANELDAGDQTAQQAGVIASMEGDPDVIDEEYTVGYAPVDVDQKEWVVVTHGPRSEVFGFVDTISTYGLFVSIFAVLLIAVTGSMLGLSTATSIDRLTTKTKQMREGDLDVNFETTRVDNIGQLYDGFGEMQTALKEQIQEAESARDEAEQNRREAEVARAEAEELASYLQERAEEYSEIMQEVGMGDMTQRMEPDGEEESMDRIAEEFNDMIEELEKTVGQLKDYVDEVEQAGAEVEQSADTVRKASEDVADSIQKISDSAYDQKERLQGLSETIDDVAATLESVDDTQMGPELNRALESIREMSVELNDIAQLSEETMGETDTVAGAAEEQAAELNEVSERANDLQRYAKPLRDILEGFETEASHEFVFSVGPTGGSASPGSPGSRDDQTDDDS